MKKWPPLQLGVVAIEKWAFGSTSAKVANFIGLQVFLYINNNVLTDLIEE